LVRVHLQPLALAGNFFTCVRSGAIILGICTAMIYGYFVMKGEHSPFIFRIDFDCLSLAVFVVDDLLRRTHQHDFKSIP
jgi:hypothetical protein